MFRTRRRCANYRRRCTSYRTRCANWCDTCCANPRPTTFCRPRCATFCYTCVACSLIQQRASVACVPRNGTQVTFSAYIVAYVPLLGTQGTPAAFKKAWSPVSIAITPPIFTLVGCLTGSPRILRSWGVPPLRPLRHLHCRKCKHIALVADIVYFQQGFPVFWVFPCRMCRKSVICAFLLYIRQG